jgi:hypothetical protein
LRLKFIPIIVPEFFVIEAPTQQGMQHHQHRGATAIIALLASTPHHRFFSENTYGYQSIFSTSLCFNVVIRCRDSTRFITMASAFLLISV